MVARTPHSPESARWIDYQWKCNQIKAVRGTIGAILPSSGSPWLMQNVMTAALSAVLTCSAFRSRSSYKRRTSTAEVKEKNSTRTEYTKPTSSTLYTNESTTEWGQRGKRQTNEKNRPNMMLNNKQLNADSERAGSFRRTPLNQLLIYKINKSMDRIGRLSPIATSCVILFIWLFWWTCA